MDKPIKIILADDHPLVLDGIIARIDGEANIKVIAKAHNGKALLETLAKNQADVVLLDLNMPVMNGFEAMQQIKQDFPHIRVIILSMHANREYIMQLMKAGAAGYVLKDVSAKELLYAIKTVHQGNTHFSSGAAESLFGESSQGENKSGPLSKREETVLKLLADGRNNRQIAEHLSISIRTVEKHRQNIKNKLDIHTPSGLIRYAIEHNMVGLG